MSEQRGFDVDSELIRQLAQILQESGLTEIEVSEGDRKVRLTRQPAPIAAAPAVPAAAAAAPPPQAAAAPAPPAATPPEQSLANAVTSPMVGTAYLAPEPGAAPYVRIGETVSEGQTLLIVEAMKVMNPIRAPQAGVIRDVLVSDGQPVEYGEPLMILE